MKAYPIIFTHVLRSGGTTLVSILSRHFRKDEQFYFYVREHAGSTKEAMEAYKSLPENSRKKLRLLQGHTHYGIHAGYPEYTYLTLFRDPVDRTISYYYYILKEKDHYLHSAVLNSNMKLEEFVRSGITTELDNIQTRQLSGIITRSAEKCTADMLMKAKHNLVNHYPLFGLTERFDETLLLIAKEFGWNYPFYQKLNTIPGRPLKEQISPATLELIHRQNKYDIELYQFARDRFQELINKQGPGFNKQLQKFRKYNTWMQQLSKPRYGNLGFRLWKFYTRMAAR